MLLAEGDAEGAVRELHNAIRHWRDVGAPYEVARDRGLLATALQRLRRDDEADLELQASREEFHRLGAVRDEAAADDAIRAAAGRAATPAITHKTFMFTDIVASTNLAEAMGDEAWEHLLRWHDDALRAVFLDHGGEVVNSTGDGFFVAFDSASSGSPAPRPCNARSPSSVGPTDSLLPCASAFIRQWRLAGVTTAARMSTSPPGSLPSPRRGDSGLGGDGRTRRHYSVHLNRAR